MILLWVWTSCGCRWLLVLCHEALCSRVLPGLFLDLGGIAENHQLLATIDTKVTRMSLGQQFAWDQTRECETAP